MSIHCTFDTRSSATYSSNILMGDFPFHLSHFLVRYLYFYSFGFWVLHTGLTLNVSVVSSSLPLHRRRQNDKGWALCITCKCVSHFNTVSCYYFSNLFHECWLLMRHDPGRTWMSSQHCQELWSVSSRLWQPFWERLMLSWDASLNHLNVEQPAQ